MKKVFEPQKVSFRLKSVMSAALLTAMLSGISPAHAQNFNYSPYTGASNLLWLARSFAYPLNRYSGYQAPFYLANSLMWNASYGAARAFGNRPKKNNQAVDPSLQGSIQGNGNGSAQGGLPNLVSDQSVYAKWAPSRRPLPQEQQIDPYSTSQYGTNQWVPVASNSGGLPAVVPEDPFALPGSVSPNVAQAPNVLVPQGISPATSPFPQATNVSNFQGTASNLPPESPNLKAMKRNKHRRSQEAPSADQQSQFAPSTAPNSGESPLARGFIHLVNENYGGNVAKALADPEMRRYASSVGLIPHEQATPQNISSERAEIMRQIFADNSQDSASRIHAARMLLRPASQNGGAVNP